MHLDSVLFPTMFNHVPGTSKKLKLFSAFDKTSLQPESLLLCHSLREALTTLHL